MVYVKTKNPPFGGIFASLDPWGGHVKHGLSQRDACQGLTEREASVNKSGSKCQGKLARSLIIFLNNTLNLLRLITGLDVLPETSPPIGEALPLGTLSRT